MVPCDPAEAAMLNLLIANVAEIVWFACTASNVYCDTAPTEAVSTCTSAIEYPASGVMVNMSEAPKFTTDLPAGAMDPCGPAEAAMLNVCNANMPVMHG